jgi:hypothetical protein
MDTRIMLLDGPEAAAILGLDSNRSSLCSRDEESDSLSMSNMFRRMEAGSSFRETLAPPEPWPQPARVPGPSWRLLASS